MKYFSFIYVLISVPFIVAEITGKLLDYYPEGYLVPFPKECSDALQEFSESASNFTLCSIQYARPVQVCEKCVTHYVNLKNTYDNLITISVNGTTCKSLLISHDRLEVILSFHNSISSTWNNGNCDACYVWTNGTATLSNGTSKFFKMFNGTKECIKNQLNLLKNNSEEVCQACMDKYMKLDYFYQSLSKDGIGVDSVCMDVVDSMNATRSIWSKYLNCCKLRRSPEVLFLVSTGIIAVLPLLFYLIVRFCGPIRDLPKVLRQSRFKQTFLRSFQGRAN